MRAATPACGASERDEAIAPEFATADCLAMVRRLEARHGVRAADIAAFFGASSVIDGCARRTSAWSEVRSRIALRQRLRLLAADRASNGHDHG